MRRIFVAMAAGMLAVAEIFGIEPERAELAAEKEAEPVEEVVGPSRLIPSPRGEVVSLEQPHVHIEAAEEIDFEITAPGGSDPGEAPRYTLTLSPVSTRQALPEPRLVYQPGQLAYIEKIGSPVLWEAWVMGGRWKSAPGKGQMIGTEPDPERLRKDLGEKLGLPSQQVERVMAVLSTGHPIMIGNEAPEQPGKAVDSVALQRHLQEVLGLTPDHVQTVMTAVAGETDSGARSPDTKPNEQITEKPISAGVFMKSMWSPADWPELVYSSMPLLGESLSSLKVFSGSELESFGMKERAPILTLMPPRPPAV
jgi:hypothetical protein